MNTRSPLDRVPSSTAALSSEGASLKGRRCHREGGARVARRAGAA
eukprot:CAMPEP_0203904366 /NCGR_PEP_ID=MMETSP0359-20131031/46220_1 /ASSEMBLY_ACC=CAM_ASM_000338 /TAXON_ID=268821 /ORGANISM="Scrippsiella Hangoei, Strain SHTV-5" /LENGTH=44 /DNA_ID= /DNA_START= /DNA_END= /DNA_ORIENTATION=